jgi:hypothetical protein
MHDGAQWGFDPRVRFYDIYERQPDGNVEWIAAGLGLEQAKAQLSVLARQIESEVFIMDMYEDKIVARKNVPRRA